MLIQLKQSEIETAIKEYIRNQGINLVGKDVQVSFTSTKSDKGLVVDLDIEGASLADLTKPVETTPVVEQAVVSAQAPVAIAAAATTVKEALTAAVAQVAEPEAEAQATATAEVETALAEAVANDDSPFVEEEAPKKSVSLFG